MLRLFIFLIPIVVTAVYDDPSQQLLAFKEKTKVPIGIMTVSNGAPVENRFARSTLNSRLILNEYFMDSLTHFSRERIPERVVHANGAGAFGYFQVTHNITHICKAKFLSEIGKKTPIAIRFSPIAAERSASDILRDGRGFAVKFYTEQGNFDIVGLNMPAFVLRDPLFFTTFVRSMKRNPATDLPEDANMRWDFLTLRPESWNNFIRVFSDRGIPDGYPHMPGFGIHTFQVVNEAGEIHFVRFHFVPNAGEKTLSSEEARRINGDDPNYNKRNLYKAILNGEFPSWTFAMQILSLDDVKNADFDVSDATRILPLNKYPLHEVGQIVLNRNAENYFAEIEQLAFNPSHLVPGVPTALGKLYEARCLSYRDTLYYRLGPNFNKINVNCPFNTKPLTYNRDGRPPVKGNGGGSPDYFPNSFNGPYAVQDSLTEEVWQIFESDSGNMDQVRDYYLYEISNDERKRLIENILQSLKLAARFLQERAVALFKSIHTDFGSRVEQGLYANSTNIGI